MNRKTKRAKQAGYCSMKDMLNDGNKIYKGDCCDTSWNNKNSKKTGPKKYNRKPVNEDS